MIQIDFANLTSKIWYSASILMDDACILSRYDPDANEFRFDRQPRNFNSVLSFLRTGMLHLGEETCVIAFSQVSWFWK